MYIATVPNRGSPPAILLRESYRVGDKVKSRTLANLSKLPPRALEALRRTLRGEELVSQPRTPSRSSKAAHASMDTSLRS